MIQNNIKTTTTYICCKPNKGVPISSSRPGRPGAAFYGGELGKLSLLVEHLMKIQWKTFRGRWGDIHTSVFLKDIYIISISIPGTPMTSIFEGQPPKTRPFPTKTRVIWVPGIYIYDVNLQVLQNIQCKLAGRWLQVF